MERSKVKEFHLPAASERAVVFGRTGSGKTVFMVWLLSHASIDERPWVILDYKNDETLRALPKVERIKLGAIPKYPGIYLVTPTFKDDIAVDAYLHNILARGNVGLFTDEGGKIPQREPRFVGLKSLFAQGRSKRCPVLFATQRPSWINKSVLSEGDYYALFHLQDADDRARAAKVVPKEALERRLDEYRCHWYDVKRNASFEILPVNPEDALERLDARQRPRMRFV